MTEEQARDRLELMTQADREPTLDPDEIQLLVLDSRRVDSGGREPDDSGWEGFYDLNWGAAEGWGLKKGKAANMNLFLQDNRSNASDFTFLNCERMEKYYRAKSNRESVRGVSVHVETVARW